MTVNAEALRDLRRWDMATGVQRVQSLCAALPTCGDRDALRASAAALPRHVEGLPAEVSLALAELALELAPYEPTLPDDVSALAPHLQVAWHRAGLASGSTETLAEIGDEQLRRAVTGWSLDAWVAPTLVLERLLGARCGQLRALGLGMLPSAVHSLAATPVQALRWTTRLAADPEPHVREAAVALLGASWVHGGTFQDARERRRAITTALADTDAGVARAALRASTTIGACREATDALRTLLQDPGHALRSEALEALGEIAEDSDVDLALALGESDPLLFGPAVRHFLLATHRRGVFVRDSHVDAVLRCFDAHHAWTAEELVRVTYIARATLVERLSQLPADDPRWRRRAAVLGSSVGTGAHQLLERLLGEVRSPSNAVALIHAASCSPEYSAELPLLRLLDEHPEPVLRVLELKGGPETYERVLGLALDPAAPTATRVQATRVAWALSTDRDRLLRDMTTVLGPRAAGLFLPARREPQDSRVAVVLTEVDWDPPTGDPVLAVEVFNLLCECGEYPHLPRVVALFRQQVERCVQLALEGDFTVKRQTLPELEQQLYRFGRRMVDAGRTLRRYHEDGPETGRDLVLRVALDWLDEAPAPAVCVALLEIIARHEPTGMTLRRIEPLWRHRSREVQRAAIAAILSAGEGARGLELSLCLLSTNAEARIVVQALQAIGTLRATWAEPMALAALERPEMMVKKEAARALAQVGGPRAVAPLLAWLGRHDNRAFRADLSAALAHAAGTAHAAVLVEALASPGEADDGEHGAAEVTSVSDPRRTALLHDALSGVLPMSAALRLSRSTRPCDRALVEACLAGEVALADADATSFAAALHRARGAREHRTTDPARRLRVEGFSADAARELLGRSSEQLVAALPVVRHGLADWVTWMMADPGVVSAHPHALELVLDAAHGPQHEHFGALMALAEVRAEHVPPRALVAFVERCIVPSGDTLLRARAVMLLRTAPMGDGVSGRRRFGLLAKLGAVRDNSDVVRCLDAARCGPDYAGESAALLAEALQLPARTASESDALRALREEVEAFFRWPHEEQARWLEAALVRRPLDVFVGPEQAPRREAAEPKDARALAALLRTLAEEDPQAQTLAASRILAWPDATDAWPAVLSAYLAGRIRVSHAQRAPLATVLMAWPEGATARRAAATLFPHCPPWQQRAFVSTWVRRWLDGDQGLTEQLASTPEDLLLPHARDAAERGDYRLVRCLAPSSSVALRHFREWLEPRSSDDAARLHPRTSISSHIDAGTGRGSDDPLLGLDATGLAALIGQRDVKKGLAVRAIHALAGHGDAAIGPLSALALNDRAHVRSTALRALKKVAPRSVTLPVTLDALAVETRHDVVVQLLKSLGHARHEPALPALLEHCTHADARIARGAHEALRGWGPSAIPAVRAAARRARPDRRGTYEALLRALETDAG
ncbi:MAG: HEAT repeat domain-containing protein [Sandaracinaceae bacterium]|nr:HEAT repeat domain-containing protein [Sandaracinaceae bacterium]